MSVAPASSRTTPAGVPEIAPTTVCVPALKKTSAPAEAVNTVVGAAAVEPDRTGLGADDPAVVEGEGAVVHDGDVGAAGLLEEAVVVEGAPGVDRREVRVALEVEDA